MTKRRTRCRSTEERAARALGYTCIAGVDEVGRGCLFGPVFAGAVVLDPDRPIRGLADSKQLDAETREELAAKIRERAVAWAVAGADVFVEGEAHGGADFGGGQLHGVRMRMRCGRGKQKPGGRP